MTLAITGASGKTGWRIADAEVLRQERVDGEGGAGDEPGAVPAPLDLDAEL